MADILVSTIAKLALGAINSLCVMLLLGMAHSNDDRIPALGYFTLFPLVIAVAILTNNEDD